MLQLDDKHYITSDKGIFNALLANSLDALFVDPTEIILPGHNHGLFGGACGIYNKTIFLAGSLKYFAPAPDVIPSCFHKYHFYAIYEATASTKTFYL